MKRFVSRNKFLVVGSALILLVWLTVSAVNLYLSNSGAGGWLHEHFRDFWIMLLFTHVIIGFSIYVDWMVEKKRREEERERTAIYRTVVWASHHIMNNFLNKCYLVEIKAMQAGSFDEEAATTFSKLIQEASEELRKLGGIEEVSENAIKEAVEPK